MAEEYDPLQIAAYSKESLEKCVVIQHLMIQGTGPNMKRPGGGVMVVAVVEPSARAASNPRLNVRCDCPDELLLPSDRCENERSVSGWLPNPLPVLTGASSVADLFAWL